MRPVAPAAAERAAPRWRLVADAKQAGGTAGAAPLPARRRDSLWLVVRRQPDHHPALRLMEVDHTDLQDNEVWLVGLEASYKAL